MIGSCMACEVVWKTFLGSFFSLNYGSRFSLLKKKNHALVDHDYGTKSHNYEKIVIIVTQKVKIGKNHEINYDKNYLCQNLILFLFLPFVTITV